MTHGDATVGQGENVSDLWGGGSGQGEPPLGDGPRAEPCLKQGGSHPWGWRGGCGLGTTSVKAFICQVPEAEVGGSVGQD